MGEKVRLIATEEAWSIPEVAAELKKVARSPSQSLDKLLVKGIYDADEDTSGYGKMNFLEGLLDVEQQRLPQMDQHGVDMHLLTLTAPGVQMFDADTATDLAALANDRLAEICRGNPKRFAGLGSFAPHSPKRAAKEIERCMTELKLNGMIVNGHTHGDYFDDYRFWPALEAAERSSQLALESNLLGYQVGVRINIDVLNAQIELETKEDLEEILHRIEELHAQYEQQQAQTDARALAAHVAKLIFEAGGELYLLYREQRDLENLFRELSRGEGLAHAA